MKKNAFLIMMAAILVTATVAACGNSSASENNTAEEAVSPASVSETPALRSSDWPSGSGTTRRTTPGREAVGTQDGVRYMTILIPKSQVIVLNRVPGMVNELNVEEGDRVRAGNVLASLDQESYRLRAIKAAAEADRMRAIYHRNLEASGEEVRVRIVSELELEISRTEYLQAQADSALMAIELGYTDIKAPISGYVIERRIQAGQWLGMQEECFTIADLSPLWAVFTVPQSIVAELSVDKSVTLTVDPAGEDPFTVGGRLLLVSPVVDPGGGVKITVEVYQLAGSPQIRAGMTAALESGSD